MVATDELAYLHWLGREHWDGRTNVVEFGPWLGGTTNVLAAGMKRNPNRDLRAKLHTIDNFVWRSFMGDRAAVSLRAGESFRRVFDENMSDHLDLIVVHETRLPDDDLGDCQFDEPIRDQGSGVPLFAAGLVGGPIQVVFVDGAKSWHGLHHMLSQLTLGPGALVVLQDFQDWASYWVPMMIGLLREQGTQFELSHVLASGTISLRLMTDVDMNCVPVFPQNITVEHGSRLVRSVVDWIAPEYPAAAHKVALSEVVWLGVRDRWDESHALLQELAAHWPLRNRVGPLEQTMWWARRTSGRSVPQNRRVAARHLAESADHRIRQAMSRVRPAVGSLR